MAFVEAGLPIGTIYDIPSLSLVTVKYSGSSTSVSYSTTKAYDHLLILAFLVTSNTGSVSLSCNRGTTTQLSSVSGGYVTNSRPFKMIKVANVPKSATISASSGVVQLMVWSY